MIGMQCASYVSWPTPERVEEFVGGRRPEEGRMQDGWQLHGYNLNHIDFGVCDRRVVKHWVKSCTQPTESFTPGIFAQNLTYSHTR